MSAADDLLQGLLARGFNRAQAAALVGNMQQESGFHPGIVNPGEGAQGLIQWRQDRLTNLKNFAAQNGQSYTDPNAQLDFIVHEMTGSEAKNAKNFLNATDVNTANAALKRYIRYGDNTEPVRLQNALAYADNGANANGAQGAVNNLASARPVQTVGYVPAPFSGQQGNFAPLFQDQAPQSAPTSTPAPQQPAPQAAPNDVLKAWGVTDESAPKTQEPDGSDILKAWGIDQNAGTPAAEMATSQSQAPATFGQKVGGLIDAAGEYAAPVGSFVNNVGRQIATGFPIIGGALNRADAATNALLAPALNPLFSKENQLQGDTWSERYQNALNEQNANDQQFQTDHPIVSTGAQIAGGVGSMVGAARAIPGAANALGLTGSLGARTVAGGLSGAAIGGADAAVRSDGDPTAIENGLLTGAGIGLVAPAAGKLIGAGANKLLGSQLPERVAQLAQLARDRYGINIGPGQLSTSPTIKFLDSVVNRLPFSGGVAAKEAQQQAFNSAVANSFGETAKEITPEVIKNAKGRIGQIFESVAERTPAIRADGQLASDLKTIINDAGQTLQASEYAPLQKQLQEIVGKFKDGGNVIDGDVYQAFTRKGAPLDRLQQSNDPNIRYYASQIRDALDGTLERSAPPEALADLRTARQQWKALKTVEPLAEKSATGDISPSQLLGQASKGYGSSVYGQGADLVDLGRIGQQFLKEAPSSGTAERTLLHNALLGGGSGAGIMGLALNPGAIPMAAGVAGASAIGGRLMGAALRSPRLAGRMIENSLGEAGQGGNLLLRSAPTGGIIPQANQRQPLELTVRKPASQAAH